MRLYQSKIRALHMIEHRTHVDPVEGAVLQRQELGACCDEIKVLIKAGICRPLFWRNALQIIDKRIDRNKFRSLWKKMNASKEDRQAYQAHRSCSAREG